MSNGGGPKIADIKINTDNLYREESLSEAADKLPDAIEKTVQAMIAEAQEMERKESSRIVVP
jgi:predicted ATP-grasp superfamily ATP-dependent carboligase